MPKPTLTKVQTLMAITDVIDHLMKLEKKPQYPGGKFGRYNASGKTVSELKKHLKTMSLAEAIQAVETTSTVTPRDLFALLRSLGDILVKGHQYELIQKKTLQAFMKKTTDNEEQCLHELRRDGGGLLQAYLELLKALESAPGISLSNLIKPFLESGYESTDFHQIIEQLQLDEKLDTHSTQKHKETQARAAVKVTPERQAIIAKRQQNKIQAALNSFQHAVFKGVIKLETCGEIAITMYINSVLKAGIKDSYDDVIEAVFGKTAANDDEAHPQSSDLPSA